VKKYPTPEESRRDWLLVAKDALRGEYQDAKGSEIETLIIGMRSIDTDECRKAVKQLDPKGQFSKSKKAR
jgi:hypothetical protein